MITRIMYVLMFICNIIAFIYTSNCQDIVVRETNRSEGISDASTRKFFMNYIFTIFLYMPSEKITHVLLNLQYHNHTLS